MSANQIEIYLRDSTHPRLVIQANKRRAKWKRQDIQINSSLFSVFFGFSAFQKPNQMETNLNWNMSWYNKSLLSTLIFVFLLCTGDGKSTLISWKDWWKLRVFFCYLMLHLKDQNSVEVGVVGLKMRLRVFRDFLHYF